MRKNLGQSLVEAVMAIAVVMIIIVALMVVTTVSVRNVIFSRNQALATKYAQEWIEDARKLRDSQPESVFFVNGSCNASGIVGGFARTRVCNLTVDGDKKAMIVTVTVSWTDAKGTHKSELTTYLTKWK